MSSDNINYDICSVTFDFYTSEEVEKMSMKKIKNPQVYNNLGMANIGGLSDPSLGVSAFDRTSICEVCKEGSEECTGHFGYINLCSAVYHPFMFNQIHKILNSKCFNCQRLKISKKDYLYLFMKLFLIKIDLLKEAEDLKIIFYPTCPSESLEKIYNFLKDNICVNKEYLSEICTNSEKNSLFNTNDNTKISNSDNNSSNNKNEHKKTKGNKKLNKSENEDILMDEEISEDEGQKNGNKKKVNTSSKDEKNKEIIENKMLEEKEKLTSCLFSSLSFKIEEIRRKKDKIVYRPSLSSNTMLKEFEKEFWSLSKCQKCEFCGAYAAKFKKVSNLRFFRLSHSKKEKKKMKDIGIKSEEEEEQEIKKSEKKSKKSKKKKQKKNSEEEEEDEEEDSESESEENNNKENEKRNFIHITEVKKQFEEMFERDPGLIYLFYGNIKYDPSKNCSLSIVSTKTDIFFINNLIVPPPRFRPENKAFTDDGAYCHRQTAEYIKILNLDNDIRELSKKLNETKEELITDNDEKGLSILSKSQQKHSKANMLADSNISNSDFNAQNSSFNIKNSKKQKSHLQKSNFEDLLSKCIQLQAAVNVLFDSSKGLSKKDQEAKGIRQLIEKKEGLIRMKMMGKRVNHSGRTVLSPDPLIGADEVGVPLCIAGKLFYPEKVNKFNIDKVRNMVKNGPFNYPGASHVTFNDGRVISLMNIKPEIRQKIANDLQFGQTVRRHLANGDILLFNRQPTLHRPSIMGHLARVLKGEKTFRMHYSNCSSYNADFDGDEMNIHFLQDSISREEAYTIANTSNQYIVPTNGKPIRGLLQDSIDSLAYLTKKDTFFTREEYFQLLYASLESALNNKKIKKIITVIPCIIKPKELYSGKQVISSILMSLSNRPNQDSNITLTYSHKNRLGPDVWGVGNEEEGIVRVQRNELITGVLDKNEIGASELGLIHSFYEIFGPDMAGELITTLGKLGVFYFQRFHAFTCSLSDMVFDDKTNLKRRVDIENMLISGMKALGNYLDIKDFEVEFDNYSRRSFYISNEDDKKKQKELIKNMKISDEERKEIKEIIKLQNMKIDENLFKYYSLKGIGKYDDNDNVDMYNNSYKKIKELRDKYEEIILKDSSLDENIDSVVKSALNQETSKKTKKWLDDGLITPFPDNSFTMMVKSGGKGTIVNHTLVTCLLGQQELEGRRAPRMSNGRTLPSFAAFDPNPRSSGFVTDRYLTGIRPQEYFFHMMAGREGLIDTAVKTSRSGYLQRCLMKHLEQLMISYDYTVRDQDDNVIQFYYGEDSIDPTKSKFLDNFKFICENFDSYNKKFKPERVKGKLDIDKVKKYRSSLKNNGELFEENDTTMNRFEPWKFVGSISDKVYKEMHDYIVKNPDNHFSSPSPLSKTQFKNIVYLKYLSSLASPGESVGVLAAQGIGEPSTQMTLNTFHLAGHGGANVTLGIPRLREILMTSEKNIKTPIMTIPMKCNNMNDAKKIARIFENHKLIDILKELKTKQTIKLEHIYGNNNNIIEKYRVYEVKMYIENEENIKEFFGYNKKTLIKILKGQFIPLLAKYISRYMKINSGSKGEVNVNVNPSFATSVGEEEEGETRRKKNEEEEESEDEDEENMSENNEKTYGDKYVESDEGLSNKSQEYVEEEEEEDEDGGEKESNNISNKANNNVVEEDSKEKKQNSLKTNKKSNNNPEKELLERKAYQYNDILFDNMKFISYKELKKKEENIHDSCLFSFELCLPYIQKNILLKNILDIILKKLNFKSVKNIKNCHILEKENKDNKKEYNLQLEGFNFEEVVKHDQDLDMNHLQTNDIGGILGIYGIEACRSAIVKEIMNVFDVYSIKVDKRHLGLIADYITFQGIYRSFSRNGISYSSSALLKMSYETTMDFLINACTGKTIDDCKTDSGRIIVGRPPRCGTGAFDILKNREVNNNMEIEEVEEENKEE